MSNYWIGDSLGRVLGPLTLQSLRELVGSGRLKAVTRASRDGTAWEPIEQFNEVKDLLGALKPNLAAGAQQAEKLRQQLREMQSLPAHQLFGVKAGASLEEMRNGFFNVARRYSPEHHGSDVHPELRKASAEVFELLARRMREAEAQLTANAAPRAAPGARTATPLAMRATPAAAAAAPQAPVFTYSAEEFVGLTMRNERLQVTVQVNARNVGMFTDHRIINLQAGGLFIPTKEPLRLGTRVELILNFEKLQRQIRLRSSVIWEYTLDDGKQPRGYGLGLADLRPEERAVVEGFVRDPLAHAGTSNSNSN